MDTAPTGHTLLLLDATGAYHRDVTRNLAGSGMRVTTPMMQLQDPKQAKVLIVTLAETTPVLEAAGSRRIPACWHRAVGLGDQPECRGGLPHVVAASPACGQ